MGAANSLIIGKNDSLDSDKLTKRICERLSLSLEEPNRNSLWQVHLHNGAFWISTNFSPDRKEDPLLNFFEYQKYLYDTLGFEIYPTPPIKVLNTAKNLVKVHIPEFRSFFTPSRSLKAH